MLRHMPHRFDGRRLYIADLARRQHAMESAREAMHALTYRVVSRSLRQALAGLPAPTALAGFPELPMHLMPVVVEALETRHFEDHGRLFGASAAHSKAQASALLGRLQRAAGA